MLLCYFIYWESSYGSTRQRTYTSGFLLFRCPTPIYSLSRSPFFVVYHGRFYLIYDSLRTAGPSCCYHTASKERPTSITVPSSPKRRTIQVFDKKAVPTLDKFTGRDEDYFAWKESTINVLGTAGYGRFFTVDQMPIKYISLLTQSSFHHFSTRYSCTSI